MYHLPSSIFVDIGALMDIVQQEGSSSQRIENNWVSRSAFRKGDQGSSVASLHDTFLLGCSQNTATPGHQALPAPAYQVNGQSGHSDARPARL